MALKMCLISFLFTKKTFDYFSCAERKLGHTTAIFRLLECHKSKSRKVEFFCLFHVFENIFNFRACFTTDRDDRSGEI